MGQSYGMVVSPKDVVADQPSGGAAHQNVGREVLLAHDPRQAYARGHRVDSHLAPF